MIDSLRSLIETVGPLPDSSEQESLWRIRPSVDESDELDELDELDERAWDDAFADPRSGAVFAKAEAALENEQAAGTLIPLDDVIGRND